MTMKPMLPKHTRYRTADKGREDSSTNYTMSDPPFVCSPRADSSSFEIPCTHDPRLYARKYIHMHTQTAASSNRLPLFTLLLLFSSPGSRRRRFSFSPPPGDGSFYCARALGKRNPSDTLSESVVTTFSPFSSFNLATFWRRCFDQFCPRERPLATRSTSNAPSASFTHSGKRKRRAKESSGPYGSCRYTFSPS